MRLDEVCDLIDTTRDRISDLTWTAGQREPFIYLSSVLNALEALRLVCAKDVPDVIHTAPSRCVPDGYAVVVSPIGRVLYMGRVAMLPHAPKWPAGSIVNLSPMNYAATVEEMRLHEGQTVEQFIGDESRNANDRG